MKLKKGGRVTGRCLAGTLLAALVVPSLQAETITIGKGKGIIWEGLQFSKRLSGPMESATMVNYYGLLAVSKDPASCMQGTLRTIAGYKVFPLPGATGVGIIPRASGLATFGLYRGGTATLTATIGLPETQGTSSTEGKITYRGRDWCVPPSNGNYVFEYYDAGAPRSADLTGTWVIVADGSQKNSEITMPPLYFGSYANDYTGDRYAQIFPSNLTLRISTLECKVNTPTTINFGAVSRNSEPNAALATQTLALTTSCGQDSSKINANINLQLRALTGLYEGDASRLSLQQGGGYITGEIDNGLTGSGECASSSGVNFDNEPIKLGEITSTETSKVITNQLTWRLCSGGSSLPTGAVNAAAELLVTFN